MEMTTNNFETVNEDERPSTPETMRSSNSPPRRIRRQGHRSLFNEDGDITTKYLYTDIEIKNLKKEIKNLKKEIEKLRYEIIDHLSTRFKQSNEITSYKNKISTIQELLFENAETMPNWVYIQLMNALVVNSQND
jgi:predicted RNase H-like nuclease (RuvC/YqgF family)